MRRRPGRANAGLATEPRGEPGRDCPRCPRLVAFRQHCRASEPTWHNAPVDTFGRVDARLVIVGLAPGLRGANRTGRPFTGDYAGDLLYATLLEHGFARGAYAAKRDDGMELVDCCITNAVRCVPPQNKPLPAEIAACQPFLAATLAANDRLAAILALGRIAHDSVLTALACRRADYPFRHGARHHICRGQTRIALFDSYHCSRYNTNTGRLSPEMFRAVLAEIQACLAGAPGPTAADRSPARRTARACR